jgi:SAM-dependent methyltransferase
VDRAAVLARVAARYRSSGRFARHYVAAKLRHDPLTDALLGLCATEGFGTVADLGCGRGQFAALLLEAGMARAVVGLEANAKLRAQAGRALADVPFEARAHDLATDGAILQADTVLLLDVLYQLPTAAQARLLDAVARSARRLVVIRTADPQSGWRALLTRGLEGLGRGFWPHSGAMVNPRPVDWIAARLTAAGWRTSVAPCRTGTPFANVMLTARRQPG